MSGFIFKIIKKIIFIFIILLLLILFIGVVFIRRPSGITENIEWNISFSKPYAQDLGLDWQQTYLDILDELKPKSLRLPIYWQDIETQAGIYSFEDYDWMIEEAKKRNVRLILAIGRKLPRWPECHVPIWASGLEDKSQQKRALDLIPKIVERYRKLDNLYLWQIENEPFLPFGNCPKLDSGFLDQEISLVRSLDNEHKIMITDSGELSLWIFSAKRADIFGTTMYRTIYNKYIGKFKYPLPPKFFWVKTNFIHLFYPNKKIIVSELQGEPWGPKLNYEMPLEEQLKYMNFSQFRDNIEYAKKVGFPEVYLWGVEWWYWLKEKHNYGEFWEYGKEIIAS